MIDLDEIITLQEAGEIVGRSPETLKKACQRGNLRAKKVGGADHRSTWITTRSALEEYIVWSRTRTAFLPRDDAGRIIPLRKL